MDVSSRYMFQFGSVLPRLVNLHFTARNCYLSKCLNPNIYLKTIHINCSTDPVDLLQNNSNKASFFTEFHRSYQLLQSGVMNKTTETSAPPRKEKATSRMVHHQQEESKTKRAENKITEKEKTSMTGGLARRRERKWRILNEDTTETREKGNT